jgi:hypothetical protein
MLAPKEEVAAYFKPWVRKRKCTVESRTSNRGKKDALMADARWLLPLCFM